MPPKRMTRAELSFSGALKRNPGRYANRGNASTTLAPLGYAPKHLSAELKTLWRQLLKLAPAGLLTVADEFSVELAVRAIHRSRTAAMTASELSTLVNLLGKLGMTPADRSRLDIAPPPDPEGNPFDQF